jgi:hypothetical protein
MWCMNVKLTFVSRYFYWPLLSFVKPAPIIYLIPTQLLLSVFNLFYSCKFLIVRGESFLTKVMLWQVSTLSVSEKRTVILNLSLRSVSESVSSSSDYSFPCICKLTHCQSLTAMRGFRFFILRCLLWWLSNITWEKSKYRWFTQMMPQINNYKSFNNLSMKMKLGDVICTFHHELGICLPGSRHFLQSAILPATLAVTFSDMERRVGLCLQVEGNQSFVTQLIPHLPRYWLAKFNFHR